MRYAQIRKMDISNGEGVGVALFTQGCHFHCQGCHNPEQWSFEEGKEFTVDTINQILELISPSYITRFSILGGEPLEPCNRFYLYELIMAVKYKRPDIKIWLYTGYTFEELQEEVIQSHNNLKNTTSLAVIPILHKVLLEIDYLVEGRFIESQRDITLNFRGSSNQRILDSKKIRQINNFTSNKK